MRLCTFTLADFTFLFVRLNQSFRIAFMFQNDLSPTFLQEFDKLKEGMSVFLDKLEENAGQIDKMHKVCRISSVAGSSVGAAGGVLSIVGLALSPVTAGLSLSLTIAGIGLGVGSGVSGIATTVTESLLNRKKIKEASQIFEGFMNDVKVLYDCLDKVSMMKTTQEDLSAAIGNVALQLASNGKTELALDALVDAVSSFRRFNSTELISGASRFISRAATGAGRIAMDIPDIGQAAARGAAGFARAARAGFIAVNALFVGVDLYFIFRDGLFLAKGNKPELVKFFTARTGLWRSQMKTWEKICESQRESQKMVKIHLADLDAPFYPARHSDHKR